MASADVRVQSALQAVAGAADGLSLPAARRLGAAALAAAALPPEQQLAAVLQLAVARPDEGLHPQTARGAADGEQQQQWHWVLAATAIELLVNGHSSATVDQVTGVLEHQVLPLLAIDTATAAGPPEAAASQQQQEELLAAVAPLVAGCGCWDLGLQLVRAAAVSSPPTHPRSSSSSPAADAGIADQLPPHMRVRLAAAVVQQALEAASRPDGHPQAELDALLHHAATQTLPDVLALQATGPPMQRRQRGKGGALPAAQLMAAAIRAAALQLLLPAALQAAVQQQGQAAAMEQLWEACK